VASTAAEIRHRGHFAVGLAELDRTLQSFGTAFLELRDFGRSFGRILQRVAPLRDLPHKNNVDASCYAITHCGCASAIAKSTPFGKTAAKLSPKAPKCREIWLSRSLVLHL
jgi:hypothetical protein